MISDRKTRVGLAFVFILIFATLMSMFANIPQEVRGDSYLTALEGYPCATEYRSGVVQSDIWFNAYDNVTGTGAGDLDGSRWLFDKGNISYSGGKMVWTNTTIDQKAAHSFSHTTSAFNEAWTHNFSENGTWKITLRVWDTVGSDTNYALFYGYITIYDHMVTGYINWPGHSGEGDGWTYTSPSLVASHYTTWRVHALSNEDEDEAGLAWVTINNEASNVGVSNNWDDAGIGLDSLTFTTYCNNQSEADDIYIFVWGALTAQSSLATLNATDGTPTHITTNLTLANSTTNAIQNATISYQDEFSSFYQFFEITFPEQQDVVRFLLDMTASYYGLATFGDGTLSATEMQTFLDIVDYDLLDAIMLDISLYLPDSTSDLIETDGVSYDLDRDSVVGYSYDGAGNYTLSDNVSFTWRATYDAATAISSNASSHQVLGFVPQDSYGWNRTATYSLNGMSGWTWTTYDLGYNATRSQDATEVYYDEGAADDYSVITLTAEKTSVPSVPDLIVGGDTTAPTSPWYGQTWFYALLIIGAIGVIGYALLRQPKRGRRTRK